MKTWLLTPVTLFFLIFVSPGYALDLKPFLDGVMKGTSIPAMGALAMRDGRIEGDAVSGLRRNDGSDPVRIDNVWLIGSDGKAMTATLIARLVDRGVLSWDAPLAGLLPDLAASMRPEYRPVTLLQLLSHHAGLPDNIRDVTVFNRFFTDPRPLPAQRLAYIAGALKEAPIAAPGTRYEYSNTGFVVAAAIAERATGKRYEDMMRNEVFRPLGMTSAGFGLPGENEPFGHNHGKPQGPLDGNPLMFAPAGNIYLSLDDWGRFCLDQIAGPNGHGQLLKPATYALMQTPQPNGGPGLGWAIQGSFYGHPGPALLHSGSDGNWFAVAALPPGGLGSPDHGKRRQEHARGQGRNGVGESAAFRHRPTIKVSAGDIERRPEGATDRHVIRRTPHDCPENAGSKCGIAESPRRLGARTSA